MTYISEEKLQEDAKAARIKSDMENEIRKYDNAIKDGLEYLNTVCETDGEICDNAIIGLGKRCYDFETDHQIDVPSCHDGRLEKFVEEMLSDEQKQKFYRQIS